MAHGISQLENRPWNFKKTVTFSGGAAGFEVGTGKPLYVDGDLSVSGKGTSWDEAFITIQEAVTAADPFDVIYIAAKEITDTTGDPTSYAETIIIPATAPGIALIGVSRGQTQGGLPQIKIGAGSTPLLTIRAPGCLITNLGFNGASSTGGGILLDDDYSTKSAFGTTIDGCHFKNCARHATDGRYGGAINWNTTGNAWQVRITNNVFYKCLCDIALLGTSSTVPQDVVIENNIFSGSGANTDVNIYSAGSGFGAGFVIRNCVFSAIPAIASGSVARYTDVTGSGVMVDCKFASAGTTTGYGAGKATAKISTGIIMMNNYSSAGLIVREA